MFSDIEQNIAMLKGAYRKLKSYYYYNKNFIMMRKKITEFEYNHKRMEDTFVKLANILKAPEDGYSQELIALLIRSIDFYVLPKKFMMQSDDITHPVSNLIQRNKKMISVNFFINAKIEVYILDALWTILASKMVKEKSLLSHDVYGNTINHSALIDDTGVINFESNILFNRYFNRYTAWRNNAFKALERNYTHKKDSILISLDIKSFFYSVKFDFGKISEYFNNHEMIKSMQSLTDILSQVYIKYYEKIKRYRKDLDTHSKNQLPLPIGLFSSMLIGNIYLGSLDEQFRTLNNVKFYGRYVDDILLVVSRKITSTATNKDILKDVLVDSGIVQLDGDNYIFSKYPSLTVQGDKIKIIYLDHNESRAIIDIYNNTIRIIPSQMDPIPNADLDLKSFDETAYNIDKLTKEHKIRDIGFGNVDTFKVGRFFSALPYRYAHINISGDDIKKEIKSHIDQVKKFFAGSQNIEFYMQWQYYVYFLVITQRNIQLMEFVGLTENEINNITADLDINTYKYNNRLLIRIKKTLLEHLEICLNTALAIDIDTANKHFPNHNIMVKKTMDSNMFQHSYVAIPLANYLEYKKPISYSKMEFSEIGHIPKKIENCFKFQWSPRYIHYDEFLLLLFYHHHKEHKRKKTFGYNPNGLIDKYCLINHIKGDTFSIQTERRYIDYSEEYTLEKVIVPVEKFEIPSKVNIAVGSIDITEANVLSGLDRWNNISINNKKLFYDILSQSHNCFNSKERGTMLLVFPEFYFPIYWIMDLIRFARVAQIGIITGLQYLKGEDGYVHNYLATILPFKSGNKRYKNVFLDIREKNDYSPLEFEGLAREGLNCKNTDIASYKVFHWKGLRIAPVECFELTDIQVRALLKGRCDIIAAPVFNPDTTYFSNIIDSTVRDIHAFVVQANTSHLGDSRVTGPYDRDSKDIYKIKGGDNDHVVIGTIEFEKVKEYQERYYDEFNNRIDQIKMTHKITEKKKNKPDIKPLSARFKNKEDI